MAKFVFLFIAIFCIVQLTLSARLPRETEAETTTPNILDSLAGELEKFGDKVRDFANENFTKENLDKLAEQAKNNFGQFQNSTTDLLNKFAKSASDAIDSMKEKKPEQNP